MPPDERKSAYLPNLEVVIQTYPLPHRTCPGVRTRARNIYNYIVATNLYFFYQEILSPMSPTAILGQIKPHWHRLPNLETQK